MLNHLENESIPATNNTVENYYRTTLPRKHKRIYRTLKGTHREKLSAALKAAWAEVKNVAKVAFSGMIKIVNPSKAHYDDDSECKYITFKLWEKGSKRRVYINDYKRRTVGFIENGTVEIQN